MAKMLPKLLTSGDWVRPGKKTFSVILKCEICLHKWAFVNILCEIG